MVRFDHRRPPLPFRVLAACLVVAGTAGAVGRQLRSGPDAATQAGHGVRATQAGHGVQVTQAGAAPRPRPSDVAVPPRRVDPFDAGATAVTAMLLLLVGLGVTGPARLLLALAFVSFGPGWALLTLAGPLVGGTAKMALAAALSLAVCTAVVQGLLWLRVWQPDAFVAVLGGFSLLVVGVRLLVPAR
ncbi:MAG: hypothetical protein ACRD12_14985 [Acidimicrobiales bacterium]